MNFNMFTKLYNHHHDLIFKHFQHPKKKTGAYLPSLLILTLALHNYYSIYLPFLAISQNHTRQWALFLAHITSSDSHLVNLLSSHLIGSKTEFLLIL